MPSKIVVFVENRVDHLVISDTGQRRPLADEKKGRQRSLAFDRDRSPWLEVEALPRGSRYTLGDLDASEHPVRLHSTRRVHRVTPYVVAELVSADHPGDN